MCDFILIHRRSGQVNYCQYAFLFGELFKNINCEESIVWVRIET